MSGRIIDMVRKSALYRMVAEFRIWRGEKERFLSEAYTMKDVSSEELEDYVRTLKDFRISPSEYFHQYSFYGMDRARRDSFIMRSEMQKVYRRLVDKEIRLVFQNKPAFLKHFSRYIRRRWMLADETADADLLKKLLTDCDVIVKPVDGALGQGIYKLTVEEVREYGPDAMCRRLMKENVLVEECVRAVDAIQEFHPSSLNTVRVVTFSNGRNAEVIGAFVRFGCHGNVVDNAHAGGIFATLDIRDGKVVSNGLDTEGNEYESHPDSQKKIKGFVIPHWDKVTSLCLDAVAALPGLRFAGWDCVVLPDGEIDILEGNHGPDVDVMQSPLKKGIKDEIGRKLKSYFGYDL